jgi:hypothetical protein
MNAPGLMLRATRPVEQPLKPMAPGRDLEPACRSVPNLKPLRSFHPMARGWCMCHQQRWRISGVVEQRTELCFRTLDRRIMVATYMAKGDSFVTDKPRAWSEKRLADFTPRLSPDGRRLALALREGPNADIWIYEPLRKLLR